MSKTSALTYYVGRFLAGMALSLLVLGPPSLAHPPEDFNAKKWGVADYQGGITVYPDDSLPGGLAGNWFSRIENGYQQWNTLCCVDGFVFFSGTSVVSRSWNTCYTDRDMIAFYRDHSSLGNTAGCVNASSGKIYYMATQFDSDRPWHTGTGNSPSDKFDAFSVATHEFGHVTGTWWQSHFTSPVSCSNVATDLTMCPSIPIGKDWWRSLEQHDWHTFQALYP